MSTQDPKGAVPRQREPLPALPLDAWQETCTTVHLWSQIVGKLRLALSPMVNHWWHAPLYLSTRGLTTSPMPYGGENLEVEFDFIDHLLRIMSSSGETQKFPLAGHSVASFYNELMADLRLLGIDAQIWTVPVEVEEQIPFEKDEKHAVYNPDDAHRFWRILLQVDRVMKKFRGRFCGKASPMHFFWGSFDLATTRFSGRSAPLMESAYHVAKYVMQEAYVDECSSCGFWPGDGLGEPAFYAYHYPEPPGYQQYPVQPSAAYYHPTLHEYILPYDAMRTARDWEANLLAFLETTYEAGANLAKWDRGVLERSFLIRPGSQ